MAERAKVASDAARAPAVAAPWPSWLRAEPDPLPPTLPDGSPWPRVAVILVGQEGGGAAGSAASVAGQAYPDAVLIAAGRTRSLADAVAETEARYVLPLAPGDLIAPGGLASLVLAAALERAEVAAGLRVLYDQAVLGLDILGARPGPLTDRDASAALRSGAGIAPWRGGDVLVARSALERAGGLRADAPGWFAELWFRLARSGARFARAARPVLLQRAASGAPSLGRRLRVAALNDQGPAGGAGIAHRRLIEALRLAGHEVAEHRLGPTSSSAAAEWTDAFPEVEAAALAGRADLLIAENLHGATRSPALLGRLGARMPVAAVLHDLFWLTGRCAHPAGCARIEAGGCDALCPTPTLYPQLAPSRIADAHREKRDWLASSPAPLLLANSRWTAAEARRLAPPGARVAEIALPAPSQVFRPGDKAALRRRLGLPPDDLLILFAAAIADQPEKGAADLAAALAAVAGPGIGFVGLGRIDDPAAFPLPNLVAPGPIGDEETLAAWYGACDLYVTASRLETFGQTAVEAGLCSLPTLAYRATGLTSAVLDGVSGVLVEPAPGALAEALRALVADPERRDRLSRAGRIALEARFSHAAAALSLTEAFAGIALLPDPVAEGRVAFPAAMLDAFALSATPLPGGGGAAPASARPLLRAARRLKHRIWGRSQPLWMRRALYGADRLRRAIWARPPTRP